MAWHTQDQLSLEIMPLSWRDYLAENAFYSICVLLPTITKRCSEFKRNYITEISCHPRTLFQDAPSWWRPVFRVHVPLLSFISGAHELSQAFANGFFRQHADGKPSVRTTQHPAASLILDVSFSWSLYCPTICCPIIGYPPN